MNDLDKLIEAVEGGGLTAFYCGKYGSFLAPYCNGRTVFLTTPLDAYHGSLDAAKALYEALLPGWQKNLHFTEFADGSGAVSIFSPLPDDAGKWDFAPKFEAAGDNPARAWLLAILKAYRSQQ